MISEKGKGLTGETVRIRKANERKFMIKLLYTTQIIYNLAARCNLAARRKFDAVEVYIGKKSTNGADPHKKY